MIFVSYSWINDEPDKMVLDFVADLRKNGYDAECDLMQIQKESAISFMEMMAVNLKKAEKVIVVLSKKFKEKADSFVGGVSEEYRYIISDISSNKKKYILVSFNENRDEVLPDFLRGREVVLCRGELSDNDKLLHKLNETNEYEFPPVNPQKTQPTTKTIGKSDIKNDINRFSSSEPFFDYRAKGAFPGLRGLQIIDNPQDCIKRLSVLLKEPLSNETLYDPIWYFRGGSSLNIERFEIVSESKCIINDVRELEIDKIACYISDSYFRDFVYIQTKSEKPTGAYPYIDEKYIEKAATEGGYFYEEYGLFDGKPVTRSEYDDGAAVIDGNIVNFHNEAKLRVRYLTPYNLVLCAKNHPFNSPTGDDFTEDGLNRILKGSLGLEQFAEMSLKLPRNRNEY